MIWNALVVSVLAVQSWNVEQQKSSITPTKQKQKQKLSHTPQERTQQTHPTHMPGACNGTQRVTVGPSHYHCPDFFHDACSAIVLLSKRHYRRRQKEKSLSYAVKMYKQTPPAHMPGACERPAPQVTVGTEHPHYTDYCRVVCTTTVLPAKRQYCRHFRQRIFHSVLY